MIKNKTEIPIFTNPELLKNNNIVYPLTLIQAIDQINSIIIAEKSQEQKQAKNIITSWVKTLWSSMTIISNQISKNPREKQKFKNEFETKLIDFITHKDHGIIHAYHVYRGMIYLDKREDNKLVPGSQLDQQAQLMALLHDSMQVLPFAIKGDNCELEYANPKNEHANIIADITENFGHVVGFEPDTMADVIFGLRNHDGSYNGHNYNEQFDYVSKLLHDADKIFGASYSTNLPDLVSGMLERNYQANKGANGSFLLRDLATKVRDLIIYGDRCFSDSVSLVRKEFKLKMATKAGQAIAKERRKHTIQQVTKVYGKYFDLTKEFIHQTIAQEFGNLGKKDSRLKLSIVGMDQKEKLIYPAIENIHDLQLLITTLYNTPIKIKDAKEIEDRYSQDGDHGARGLKIRVFNKDTQKELFIDPSIARFCFDPDGREDFLKFLEEVFSSVSDKKETTNE